jgi:hypothetical protein
MVDEVAPRASLASRDEKTAPTPYKTATPRSMLRSIQKPAWEEHTMSTNPRVITRRQVLAVSAAGAAALASGFPAPAIANSDPIKIGYLPALTGPSS